MKKPTLEMPPEALGRFRGFLRSYSEPTCKREVSRDILEETMRTGLIIVVVLMPFAVVVTTDCTSLSTAWSVNYVASHLKTNAQEI